jgi:hypothetical protein
VADKEPSENKTPQFFAGVSEQNATLSTANRAIYRIPAREGDQETLEIMVDCAEGVGYRPRDAASWGEIKLDLQKELEAVSRVAQIALDNLKKLEPAELEIEFGIELGGQAGIPLLTRHEGKANFKVTLKWAKDPKPTS